ncbi:hypothetical protein CI109_103189 [Kwoniella shandongensis]|uniref:Uncharacterized protein n=1 Tax=Kwoniella shandongensis TaxID=1734106 RepID=A0A5M6C8P5_9TREE|nr:uncharacterized protein CI109_000380 [Kwoniella shandongensis]KAA5531538.1 hypothetical protein CI109_000380 [Kwoniella shandongensis]
MAFQLHPLFSTYPGASFVPNGNYNGPHLSFQSGGPSPGYWGYVPLPPPTTSPFEWGLPPAIVAAQEGRGTGVYGFTLEGGGTGEMWGKRYGWPKYGPMPLKPELGGFVGKLNPYGRSWPHGYYKSVH